MLGLLLLYFIGRAFFDLAKKHNKNKWLFAILGIATYYASGFVFGFVFAIYQELTGGTPIEMMDDFQLMLLAIPLGLLGTAGLYFLLRGVWRKKTAAVTAEILDEELL